MEIFEGIRRVVVFLLGVLIIADSLLNQEPSVPELVIGMVMVGILPVENVLGWFRPPTRRDKE